MLYWHSYFSRDSDTKSITDSDLKLEDVFLNIYSKHFKNPIEYTLSDKADEALADFIDNIEEAKETVSIFLLISINNKNNIRYAPFLKLIAWF